MNNRNEKNMALGNEKKTGTFYVIATGAIIELLKNELTPTQLDEIKSIIKLEQDGNKLVENIFKKIKTFGDNASANIVAKLISHPVIFSRLTGINIQ
jgi:hypothetical protein